MTEQQELEIQETAGSSNALLAGLRRVLMAGIGMVVLAQDEIEDFVNRLVERGEIADGDARKLLADVLESQKKTVQGGARSAGDEVDKRLEGLLGRMNIPSKSEIDALSAKISELSKKVDELNSNM